MPHMNPGRSLGWAEQLTLGDDISLTLYPSIPPRLCLNILRDKELAASQSHSIPKGSSGFS